MSTARSLLFWLVLWFAGVSGVQATPVAVPPLKARVTDLTATLTAAQVAALEQTLAEFEQRKGSQIAVLVVPTTGEESIEQYSLRVVERWKLGRKKVDDGALLIVAKDDRTLRIEVGYGLEGALNDATAKRIISEIIVPKFRGGDFAGGIAAGIASIVKVVDGETLPAVAAGSADGKTAFEDAMPVLFVVALVAGAVLRELLGPFMGAVAAGGGVALVAWFMVGVLTASLIAGVITFVLTLTGIGAGGAGGLGRSSGWGGGGGFGGGGGGFGGGGASGRW